MYWPLLFVAVALGARHDMESTRAKGTALFAGCEHKLLGDEAYDVFARTIDHTDLVKRLPDSVKDRGKRQITEALGSLTSSADDDGKLSFGAFVALSGDFFSGELGDNHLQKDPAAGWEQIIEHATTDRKDVLEYISRQAKCRVAEVDCELVQHVKNVFHRGTDYIKLAEQNVNHFGDHARLEYQQIHRLALETAREAAKICWANTAKGPIRKRGDYTAPRVDADFTELLVKALQLDGTAAHYLSDLYAAGHIRVPRAELDRICDGETSALGWAGVIDIVGISDTRIGGLLTKEMHDEDGKRGLMVGLHGHNIWRAYGDGLLLDNRSLAGLSAVEQAVTKSLEEVFQAFMDGLKDKPAALKPTDPDTPVPTDDNFPPLFKMEDGKLMGRKTCLKDLEDLKTVPTYEEVLMDCTDKENCITCSDMLGRL